MFNHRTLGQWAHFRNRGYFKHADLGVMQFLDVPLIKVFNKKKTERYMH